MTAGVLGIQPGLTLLHPVKRVHGSRLIDSAGTLAASAVS